MQRRGALSHPHLLLVVLVAVVLAGCATVHVDTYAVRDDSTDDCRALLHDLPGELAGRDRHLVDDDVAGVWGDPAVVLRCGVRFPDPTTACVDVDDQGWRVASTADGTSWRSLGRSIQITVDVPGSRRPVATAGTTRVLRAATDIVAAHSRGRPTSCQPSSGQPSSGQRSPSGRESASVSSRSTSSA